MGQIAMWSIYSIFSLLITLTLCQYAHHNPEHNLNINQGFYTQHTTFTNPLLYHRTSPINPTSHYAAPNYYYHNNQRYFNNHPAHQTPNVGPEAAAFGLPQFDGPLFRPALDRFERAESAGQVVNYNKALQEMLEEELGISRNNGSGGTGSSNGDELRFDGSVLRGSGTSYVRVRQSFGERKNYDYAYSV